MTPPVMLVGGGPGDPSLLTLRAEQLLGGAGTVVADAVLADLACTAAPGADVLPAPLDARGLVALVAAARPPVVRLYVGDPWLHPGHAAERAALSAAGIATEPVPGISVEIGVRTAAGDPLHHRHRSVVAVLPSDSECAEGPETVPTRTENPMSGVGSGG